MEWAAINIHLFRSVQVECRARKLVLNALNNFHIDFMRFILLCCYVENSILKFLHIFLANCLAWRQIQLWNFPLIGRVNNNNKKTNFSSHDCKPIKNSESIFVEFFFKPPNPKWPFHFPLQMLTESSVMLEIFNYSVY